MNNIDFLKWIAKGYNPSSGEKFSDDDILRNPDIVARLFELVIELSEDNGKSAKKKETINISPAALQSIKIIEPETTISGISANIREVTQLKRKFLNDKIRGYLVECGYLIQPAESKYFAMAEGASVGIFNKDKPSKDGSVHTNVYYNVEAQKFIISKLPEILNQS